VTPSAEQSTTGVRLLRGPEIWGWEHRPPAPEVEPYTVPRPVPVLPAPSWLDAPVVAVPSRARITCGCLGWGFLVGAAGAAVSDLFGVGSGVISVAYVLLWTALAVWTVLRLARRGRQMSRQGSGQWQQAVRHAQWMRDCVAAHVTHQTELLRWNSDRLAHIKALQARAARQPQWGVVRPPRTALRVDVFGGTRHGRSALLACMGASTLGSGQRLVVLDLTRDQVADRLLHLASAASLPTRTVSLPEQSGALNLLAGLNGGQAGRLLAEALHAVDAPGPAAAASSTGHESRALTARFLGEVCEALEPGRLTVDRICAALRAVLRRDDAGLLSAAETDRLDRRFGETHRRQMEPLATALEAACTRWPDWAPGRPPSPCSPPRPPCRWCA
jgi:hypothetical protein